MSSFTRAAMPTIIPDAPAGMKKPLLEQMQDAIIGLEEHLDQNVADAVTNLVAGAPEALNTLKEISDAIAADPDIATTLNTAIQNVQNALDAEVAARGVAVAAVQADVDGNETDADAAIAAEGTARAAAVSALETAREALRTAIEARLAPLEADPTTATAVAAVQADVDSVEAAALAGRTALSGRIDALEVDPTTATAVAAGDAATLASANTYTNTSITNLVNGADLALDTLKEIGDALAQGDTDVTAALTAQITTESTARTNADTALSTRLDALEADPTTQTLLTAEETARVGADTALSGRLDVLEADPTTATAVAANSSDIADIRSVTGTLDGSTHLGNFSGSIITDGIAIKTALQELSNAIEATQTDVDGNEADADTALGLRVLLDGTNIPGPYADDAAAAVGGVAVGAIYKVNGGAINFRVS